MQEKAGEQGAAYIPMPKGRGFTPHLIRAPALATPGQQGGKGMRFQNGTWSYGGKSYSTLHEVLVSAWPK